MQLDSDGLWISKECTTGIHGSLRVTPAMEAGVADHVWTLE
jgi:hypothetical protein